mmetsp:Transcript_77799/g.231746  ORF Transcript_77799/g.231746 Transcript_77799/m.231746 type:complete len:237 (-) Transcript_77799:1297-2007(-)
MLQSESAVYSASRPGAKAVATPGEAMRSVRMGMSVAKSPTITVPRSPRTTNILELLRPGSSLGSGPGVRPKYLFCTCADRGLILNGSPVGTSRPHMCFFSPVSRTLFPPCMNEASRMGKSLKWQEATFGFSSPSAAKSRKVLSMPAVRSSVDSGWNWRALMIAGPFFCPGMMLTSLRILTLISVGCKAPSLLGAANRRLDGTAGVSASLSEPEASASAVAAAHCGVEPCSFTNHSR